MEEMFLKVTVLINKEGQHEGEMKTYTQISNLSPIMVIAIAEELIKNMKQETNLN